MDRDLSRFYNNLISKGVPCPKCGVYYRPEIRDDRAYIYCREHGEYSVSVKRSIAFRVFCSRVASSPNRDPNYYTNQERMVRDILEEMNIDYEHNKKFKTVNSNNRKITYWVDFYLPRYNTIIEVSPSIWHRKERCIQFKDISLPVMWNRDKSDSVKYMFFKILGYKIIELDDDILRSKKRIRDYLVRVLLGGNI